MMPPGVEEPRRPSARPELTRRRLLWSLGVALAGLPLANCAAAIDPAKPPAIRYGEDVCSSCGMIISDRAYAAAYRTTGGEVRLFDDLGEMVLYHQRQRETVATFFVQDYETRTWLRTDEAYYVVSPELRTAMGTGVVALASPANAEALAARLKGQVLRFETLLDQGLPHMSRHAH